MRIFYRLKLVICCCVCLLAALPGALFTASLSDWYQGLDKPFFNPPTWVFTPVWLILYIMMGVSVYLIWQKGSSDEQVRKGLGLFGAQLILNAAWTPLFFGLKSLELALIDIIILWFVLLATIKQFYKISIPAGRLLIPYIVWLSFAVILNLTIMIMNW